MSSTVTWLSEVFQSLFWNTSSTSSTSSWFAGGEGEGAAESLGLTGTLQVLVEKLFGGPIPRNMYLPLLVGIILFWPIILTLVMAVCTAWTWIFWLTTSIILGVFQLIYITYQFIMITFDILGLSVLKTYTMVRATFLLYVDKTTIAVTKGNGSNSTFQNNRKSVRRLWRERLDSAESYENFLKITIQEKDNDINNIDAKKRAHKRNKSEVNTTQPNPILRKSQSSGRLSTSSSPTDSNSSSPLRGFFRTRSFHETSPTNSAQGENSFSLASSIDAVVAQELGSKTADLLITTTTRLKEARLAILEYERNDDQADDFNNKNKAATPGEEIDVNNNYYTNGAKAQDAANAMKYLLVGVLKRNHLHLDDILVENARSIAESGRYGLSLESRKVIRSYYEEVENCLHWIAEAPPIPAKAVTGAFSSVSFTSSNNNNDNNNNNKDLKANNSKDENDQSSPDAELYDRISLVRKMKQNMGRTALMLSGGGAIAMYHLGVVRALIESGVYDDIKVISGTSGGSISAAMCAIRNADELHREVCVRHVSTDFLLSGEQKKKNIRWFPPLMDMATYWLKNRLLVDSAYFRRTCEFYYGDITFEEAFERTGKHVCITVSASRAYGGGRTAQRLMLNHISTPRVTLASAVAASCALPGVMAPAKLIAKNSQGVLEPFEVDGVEWIDGSVQADLPFKRISTLFAVSSFVVSQVNFHVYPFLNKSHHPNQKSLYWRLFESLEWDIRNRALTLSRLGLFPTLFGQDVSNVFKQRYTGNLTIVPRFTAAQSLGLKALSNPTVEDMEGYLKYGQIATWPYINVIRDMMRLEKELDGCLRRLEERVHSLSPDYDWLMHDEVESIESSAATGSRQVRIVVRPPLSFGSHHAASRGDQETEKMRKAMAALEQENLTLKQKLAEFESKLLLDKQL